jgi:hypothetical protein
MSISARAAETIKQPADYPSAAAIRRDQIVSHDDVDKAISYLRDSAVALGTAKARLIKAQRMIDHIEALMMLKSEQSSDLKRKADARSSDRYLSALNEEADAAGQYETMRAYREAASMRIETWRTEQSNYRAMRV